MMFSLRKLCVCLTLCGLLLPANTVFAATSENSSPSTKCGTVIHIAKYPARVATAGVASVGGFAIGTTASILATPLTVPFALDDGTTKPSPLHVAHVVWAVTFGFGMEMAKEAAHKGWELWGD